MHDVIVIGSGMGSLSAAALLASKRLKVLIIEQNWIPGGCTSSYWRKGFTFETGATTLVGMDENMPLKYILDKTGIKIPMRKLELPMQVHLENGNTINRYQDLNLWIKEISKHFDGDQEGFWKKAYDLSQFVWKASTKYRTFPPKKFSDFTNLMKSFSFDDIPKTKYAFKSTQEAILDYNISDDSFEKFVNEQLLITAQNYLEEVNFLFGATSLCYTNYSNYYVDGGLINLVNPFVEYIKNNGGGILYRNEVTQILKKNYEYEIRTKNNSYKSRLLISGLPVNNTLKLFDDNSSIKSKKVIMESEKLNSAFQLGIGFKKSKDIDVLHHQVHLRKPLSQIGSKSIFISYSHPEDLSRADEKDHLVASISTHIPDPKNNIVDSKLLERVIIEELDNRDFIKKENIKYMHSSSPKSWSKWTKREWGFVGGYPQFKNIKPWEMNECRLDSKGAYLVGDTAYPGQGIPGTALSGIIAAEKLSNDWGIK